MCVCDVSRKANFTLDQEGVLGRANTQSQGCSFILSNGDCDFFFFLTVGWDPTSQSCSIGLQEMKEEGERIIIPSHQIPEK